MSFKYSTRNIEGIETKEDRLIYILNTIMSSSKDPDTGSFSSEFIAEVLEENIPEHREQEIFISASELVAKKC